MVSTKWTEYGTHNVIPTAVSLCPFHFGVEDHGAHIVDFQLTSVLGELSVPLQVVNKRRLMCSSQIIVNRYLECAEQQLRLHNIPQKIQQLKDQWHSISTTIREIKLNSIDSLTTDLLLNAENKCGKFRTGEIDYSPETAKAGKNGTSGNSY